MASVAYSGTNWQISIASKQKKRNSCVFSLLGNNIEYSFSGSSREGQEVPIITLTASRPLNASANQLDIFQFAANRN